MATPNAAVAAAPNAVTAIPGNKKSAVGRVVAMSVFGLAIIPIAIFGMSTCGSAEGSMAVVSDAHGGFTFQPTGCASMQPYGRMGANLHGDGPNDGAVYVTLDPTHGHGVEIEVPGSCQNADGTECTVFEIPRASCETFDVSLDYTNTTVNDVRLVQGHVNLQCSLEDGTSVRGRIDFDDC